MYYEHFGLSFPPFKITPDTQVFFAGGKRGLVLEAISYAISQGEGIVKVVGEVGSGKTMLCRMLAEKVPAEVECVYLANPRLTPDTILQAIALELKLPVASQQPPPNHLQVIHALHEFLLQKHAQNRRVVVLIEEAQSMPLETLEEIRLLSNLETSRDKLLQIVLFGQPELDTNLAVTRIRQLRERITHSFYLQPLNFSEISHYLDFRLHAAGYRGAPLFQKAAVRQLAKLSGGLLRRVNILADKALLAAFAAGERQAAPRHVRAAARDNELRGERRRGWSPLGGLAIAASLSLLLALLAWRDFFWLPPTAPAAEAPPAITLLPAVSTVPPQPLLKERMEAAIPWLARADDRSYLIQIMLTDSGKAEEIEKLLRREEVQSLLPSLYVYPLKNSTQWSLLYGDFADQAAAQAALAGLPEILRRNRPFARTVGNFREKAP